MRYVLAALVALATWFRPATAAPSLSQAAHAGRVTVYAESGLAPTARTLANGAEATLTRISADLIDLPKPMAIEVRLVRRAEDIAAVAPPGRGAPAYAIGVAYPDLGIITVALTRGGQTLDAGSTLEHELGHIALGKALGDKAPHWLHEGFAYQHAGEWSWDRTETLAGMAWFGGIIELNELDRTFPAQEMPANRAYAQSYDFVGYLSRRGRWEDTSDDGDRWPFRRFLTIVGQSGDLDRAARLAFGRSLHDLFEEWKTDLTHRYMLAPVGLLGLALWVFCALLVVVAWWRKKRINRKRIAEWDEEDRQRMVAAEAEARARMAALFPDGRPAEPPHWIN